MSLELLKNHLGGRWIAGGEPESVLRDPITGEALVTVSRSGLDLAAGFASVRQQGGSALRALSYGQRAELLRRAGDVLKANRTAYFEIATANAGTVEADSAIDIDGALFTLGQYARWGAQLGDAHLLLDGDAAPLAKDGVFATQHVLQPVGGLALLINAYNFPAWGLWEKAAPALLSGVPVVVKPATATAWLAQRMVADVVEAGILPPGALSVVCGGSPGLVDALQLGDVLSFTGSAETARQLRSHPSVLASTVRLNVEADSLNAALLMPHATGQGPAFELFVREVVREMTVKSGQKCTAIRRAFVPRALYTAATEAITAQLQALPVGNPRHPAVRMGALVHRAQRQHVLDGLQALSTEAQVLHDGRRTPLLDADPEVAACLGPTLLGCEQPAAARRVHDTEVFGPVVTLMPYDTLPQGLAAVRQGQGSLVCSLYGDDGAEAASELAHGALNLADLHGRVHLVTPSVAQRHTGHGNVMPQSLHGGPGRAGGGEELGGLRALGFFHQRSALQAPTSVLSALGPTHVIRP